MKSKFFGFSAKLALAILAVGTTLTSCYDSENGDVTKPYKAPGAIYSFVGTITNDITGAAVSSAKVTVSGTGVAGEATTDPNGTYQIVVKAADGAGFDGGDVTIAVVASSSYDAESVIVKATKLVAGQAATYYNNVVVNYTEFLPAGLKVKIASNTTDDDVVLSGEDPEYIGLDIMNKTNDPLLVKRNFVTREGIIVTEQSANVYPWTVTKVFSTELLTAIRNYIKGDLGGIEPTEKFEKKVLPFSILVAPQSALKNVTVSYLNEVKKYEFSYNGEVITVTIKRIVKVSFDYSVTSFGHYHGHGHGHGHGDDLNAGGGIWE